MNDPSGFIIINKPLGITSHDVIDKLRKITGLKKIGHAGTLDPFATGVLICAIGREATREISWFVKMDKEYEAEIRLGAASDTYDRTGAIINYELSITNYELDNIKSILKGFVGKQKQVPPMYSAKKVGGKKLYQLARAGKEIKRQPAEIEIYNIELLKYKWPFLNIKVKCSSGTYIRSLAHDIGQKLGSGAYLNELKRIAVGDFNIDQAIDLKNLDKNNWSDFVFLIK